MRGRAGRVLGLVFGAALSALSVRAAHAQCMTGCVLKPVAVSVPDTVDALAVAIGDLNGDGRDDLVALTDNVSTSGDSIFVHLQRSDGTLGRASWSTGAGMPGVILGSTIAVGDVTGDGHDDILVVTVYGLEVFPQTSSGTIGAPVSISDSVPLKLLRLGDFNKDGRLDVAAIATIYPETSETIDEVHIFLQGTTGKLAAPVAVSLGFQGPTDMDVADVDGDGRLDLVVGSGAQGGFTILFGNGQGGFGTPVPYPLGMDSVGRLAYATALGVGDIDGNGRIDVALTTSWDDVVDVLLQQAGGTFPPTRLTQFQEQTVHTMAVQDLTRDKKGEVLLLDDGDLALWVSGQGSEQRYSSTNASRTEARPNSIAFGDLDGDGKLDVAMAGGNSLTSGGSVVFYGTAADLQVTVTADPDPVLAGGAVTYQVTVTNAGPDPTDGVTLTIPTGTNATASQGNCSSASATCTLGALAVGASATVTFQHSSAAAVGTLQVTTTASGQAYDPDPSNNTVVKPTTILPAADLSVSQMVFPTQLLPGVWVTVTNPGPIEADAVSVTFQAGALTIVSATFVGGASGTCNVSGSQATCSIGTIPPNMTATVVFDLSAPGAGTYTVTATATSTTADPTQDNNHDTQTFTLTGSTGVAGTGVAIAHSASSAGCSCGAAGPMPAATSLLSLGLVLAVAAARRRRSR
jgi:uncharacterized repeat protein (TIGR01451 family)